MSGVQFPWRLISFRNPAEPDGHTHLGVMDGNRVLDLAAPLLASGRPVPEGMRQLLEWFPVEALAQWLAEVTKKTLTPLPLKGVELLPPVTNPRMFYDFLGFEQHVRQIRERRGVPVPPLWYKRPAYYVGSVAPEKLFGPGPVMIPRFVEQPDYECEIALVIGHEARCTSVADAAAFIQTHGFFTLCNDWSARDYQKFDMELGLGVSHSKSIGGTSFGPALVHASQFRFNADGAPDIPIRLLVNGQMRAESNYQTAYWHFAKILAFLGQENISVFPGDILGSGTIGNGCIAEFAAKVAEGKEIEPAKYPWLDNGDEITIAADGIGTLSNTVVIL